MAAELVSDLDISAGEGSGRAAEVRFRVRVKTRSSRGRVIGVRAGELEVQVTSPPVDGAANAELMKILAEQLDVAKSAISIVSGLSGRSKLLRVAGIDKNACLERLGRLK